jgi:hypothetical protein
MQPPQAECEVRMEAFGVPLVTQKALYVKLCGHALRCKARSRRPAQHMRTHNMAYTSYTRSLLPRRLDISQTL